MPTTHYIGMDAHGNTTDACVKTPAGKLLRRWHGPTTIPALREFIESVPRPRKIAFEESPLADWLLRNLSDLAEETLACDPRKNAYIAKDSDKDDPIDAEKLCDLFRGGYLKAVHHPGTLPRVLFKQQVQLYHERVGQRVRESNKIAGLLKRWGIIVREKDFRDKPRRDEILARLPAEARGVAGANLTLLWKSYDLTAAQVKELRRGLVRQAKREEVVVRWTALPGISWIRGATLLAFLDTPWRFRSKSALWRYMGIGLRLERSGGGPGFLRVDLACNRTLKSAILGAAKTVIEKGGANPDPSENPFAWQHVRWRNNGLSPRNARRNVARALAGAAWGMWKNGGQFDPELVGRQEAGTR